MKHARSMLSNYRVLDLTDEKGWLCARLLADMGAEVIRIDRPCTMVPWSYLNAGKRSITLNIEIGRGQDLLKRLVEKADVLVESHTPGFLEGLNLDYRALSQLNPSLIMASITGFGQTGPYRDYSSSDLVASALGGQMYVCGAQDMPPLKPFGAQAYYSACLFAANGILLALWQRHTSVTGQHLDISIHECVAATLDHVLVRYFYEGVVAERQGSLYWNKAFRVFPCRDGYILMTLFYQWETLVEWLDSEDMARDLRDKKWLDREEQQRHVDHIIEVLEHWTRLHTVIELVEKGQLMHFPWAAVVTVREVIANPQLNAREYFVEDVSGKKLPSGRTFRVNPGAPNKLSRTLFQTQTHIPAPGEHNHQVFKELGLTEQEIRNLARDGVI